jgi:hypothetical protein
MAAKVRGSKTSSNPKTTENRSHAGRTRTARAQRDDTGEARQQRRGTSKTHPTSRRAGATRKDK